jgi:hypothetical protein
VRDGVFVTPALNRCEEARRIGPLSNYVRMLAARPQPAGALLGGVLGEARTHARQLGELRFCLNELLPLLQSYEDAGAHCGEDSPRISTPRFQRLEARARGLLRHLDRPIPALESPDVVLAWLGAPCAIVSGTVIPLERVTSGTPRGFAVTIGGDRYVLRTEDGRPLQGLLRDLRLETQRCAEQLLTAEPALVQMATDFLGDVESILAQCRPRDRGRYRLFHFDRDHQLQYSRGHWMLVRGPVERRTGEGSLFLGLAIKGSTRAERQSVVPRPSPTIEGLWTPQGEPARGRFCVGSAQQYRHLLSGVYFTDAEAAVQWLDAGVILTTGRSAFHQRWRKAAASRAGNRTRNIPRNRLYHEDEFELRVRALVRSRGN